ncbi:hypothetical protein FOXYSP1_20981 [Fusarium oxysporum f. sp. phaseoli]
MKLCLLRGNEYLNYITLEMLGYTFRG